MKAKISYVDFYLRPIAPQQAQLSDHYFKQYKINGTVKRVDEFEDGRLITIKYYKESNENIESILTELRPFKPLFEYIAIVDRQTRGLYTVEYSDVYNNNLTDEEFDVQIKALYDEKGRCICAVSITEQQENPNEYRVEKSFYDEDIYGYWAVDEDLFFRVFNAYYNPDGSLDYIHFNPRAEADQDDEIFTSDDYSELVARCGFSPELADYYFTDKFLPDLPK